MEIDNIIGKSCFLIWKDKLLLLYCQVVLYEIFWIFLVIFVVLIYVLIENIQVNGYIFFKGVWVFFGLCIVNWDFFIFLELEKFNFGCFINDFGQFFGFEKVYVFYFLGNNLFKIVKESFKLLYSLFLIVG